MVFLSLQSHVEQALTLQLHDSLDAVTSLVGVRSLINEASFEVGIEWLINRIVRLNTGIVTDACGANNGVTQRAWRGGTELSEVVWFIGRTDEVGSNGDHAVRELGATFQGTGAIVSGGDGVLGEDSWQNGQQNGKKEECSHCRFRFDF